jgi:hypothetical protein
MLALVDKGDAEEMHPAFWAPFVVTDAAPSVFVLSYG